MTTQINCFGLGIGSDDPEPFRNSDFYMPAAWTADDHPGSLPSAAVPGMTFVVFGVGGILATARYIGYSRREHRWEHRPIENRSDAGPGWVLDIDPNSWTVYQPPISCHAEGQSYRYGHFEDGQFQQVKIHDHAQADV